MNCKKQIDLQIIDLQSKIQSVIYHYINSGNILHCSSHELEEIRVDIDNMLAEYEMLKLLKEVYVNVN